MVITIVVVIVHVKVIKNIPLKNEILFNIKFIIKLLIEWQYLNYWATIGNSLSLLGFLVVCLIPSSFIV